MKIKFTSRAGATLLLLAGIFPTLARAAVITVDPLDAEVSTDAAGTPQGASGAFGNPLNLPGAYYAGSPLHYVAPILLPNLGPGTFSNVSFTASLNSTFGDPPNFNVDIYGISGTRTSADTQLSDASNGGTDGALLTNNFWTADPLSAIGTSYTTMPSDSAAFSAWINAQYAGGANAGQFAFLRLSPDLVNPPRSGYFVISANNPEVASRPFLSYDFAPVPEPATTAMAGLAALGLMARRRRSCQD